MDPGSSAPLGIALLGLLLGMRHATDPDHLIAVTAILSRERRLSVATRIGVIWCLGHTLTVLAVGTAIIASKLAVPTRLGLAMEFAVAVVLILLGVEAFAALVRRIASRLFGSPLPDAKNLVVHSHLHTHGGAAHRHPHFHLHLGGYAGVTAGAGPTSPIVNTAFPPTRCRRSPPAVRC